MYDSNVINTPFHDFESLEFAPKEKHASVKLWRVEILYKNGTMLIVPQTASEIEYVLWRYTLESIKKLLK